jgi:hypothetical protein
MNDKEFHFSTPIVSRAGIDDHGREFWDVEISNETKDMHGTIFKMDGLRNIDEYNADGIVQYGHPSFESSDPDDVIGTSIVSVEEDRLMARFYPEPGETNSKAAKIVNKLKTGVIKSASIVAAIYKARRGAAANGEDPKTTYFDDWELLAWGFVAKGSNPKAKLRTMTRAAEFCALAENEENANNESDLIALAESISRSIITLAECR